MTTAIDNHFSEAKWQAQGPKLLEPTVVSCLQDFFWESKYVFSLSFILINTRQFGYCLLYPDNGTNFCEWHSYFNDNDK